MAAYRDFNNVRRQWIAEQQIIEEERQQREEVRLEAHQRHAEEMERRAIEGNFADQDYEFDPYLDYGYLESIKEPPTPEWSPSDSEDDGFHPEDIFQTKPEAEQWPGDYVPWKQQASWSIRNNQVYNVVPTSGSTSRKRDRASNHVSVIPAEMISDIVNTDWVNDPENAWYLEVHPDFPDSRIWEKPRTDLLRSPPELGLQKEKTKSKRKN